MWEADSGWFTLMCLVKQAAVWEGGETLTTTSLLNGQPNKNKIQKMVWGKWRKTFVLGRWDEDEGEDEYTLNTPQIRCLVWWTWRWAASVAHVWRPLALNKYQQLCLWWGNRSEPVHGCKSLQSSRYMLSQRLLDPWIGEGWKTVKELKQIEAGSTCDVKHT